MFERCLGNSNGKCKTTIDDIADALLLRPQDVNCSLQKLRDYRIIKYGRRGTYEFLPPPITWAELNKLPVQLHQHVQKSDSVHTNVHENVQTKSSPLLRTRKTTAAGINPPSREGVYSQSGQPPTIPLANIDTSWTGEMVERAQFLKQHPEHSIISYNAMRQGRDMTPAELAMHNQIMRK